jgi:thiopeptide-type bacteriocin biosynthesis protein
MPAAHLTTDAAPHIAGGVLAVLAGAGLDTTAASLGMDQADLADAVQAYQAAGLAAVQQRVEQRWYHVRIRFPDWNTAEATAATRLAPRLDDLQAAGATGPWWFLRKYPYWRLRLCDAHPEAVAQLLDELTADGVFTDWSQAIYEPETIAFGGPAGMRTAHDLFCADSHGVLDYAQQPSPSLGRRELSLLLINAMLHAAGFDWFERGDVFARVAQLRPTPPAADATRVNALAENVRILLVVPTGSDSPLFGPGGPVAFAAPWLAAFATAGHLLGKAATSGTLDRGVRAVLTHIVIFHWNRLGLSATAQGILAQAASSAILP